MNRLFTFGCSFTSYNWSTWADILGATATEYQNWGMLGGGNQYIFNSVFECDQRNQFQPEDTIIVCWTNIFREDRYTNVWRKLGNIFTQPLYDSKWVRQNITERGCLIRDIAYIKAVKTFLEQRRVNWHFISMVPVDQSDQYKPNKNPNTDVLNLYRDVVDCIKPSFFEVLKDQPPLKFDLHPAPLDHLYYLDTVLPEYPIDNTIRKYIADEDSKIRAPGYKIPEYTAPNIKRL